MEYKVRQESQSVLEKMFASHSKSGYVSPNTIPSLLKEFNEDIVVTPEEFEDQVGYGTETVEDGLDWSSFERVMIHFLVKQSRKESNEFGHKNVISLADFDSP